MTPDIHGLLAALVTPFTGADAENVDEAGLRALVDRTIAGGVHGLVPGGSTGEFASMSLDERRRVTEVVVDQASGRVPVVPHVAAMTTREAVSLSRHAEATGVAAVMAVAPYYEPLTVPEIKSYFLAIADAISIPVVLYNLPVATGVNLTPDDIVDLARTSENIQYVKDTTGDLSQAAHLIHEHGDEVSTFVGWDTLYFAALVEGAAGSINGAANFLAPTLRSIYDSVTSGDVEAGKLTWLKVYPVMRFLISGGYVGGVRGALNILDLSAGPARLPIAELEVERRLELEAILKTVLAA